MNENRYDVMLQQILDKIGIIEKRKYSPYVHCSKLNSILLVLKNSAPLIQDFISRTQNHPSLNGAMLKAFSSINSSLSQVQDLCTQCEMENCLTFVLQMEIMLINNEVFNLRNKACSAFNKLGLQQVGELFKISENEMKNQNMVDMKRLSQIFVQVSLKRREDTKEQLTARFNSLKKMGIEISYEDATDVTIPNLPTKVNFLINRDDIKLAKTIGKGQSGIVKLGTLKGNDKIVAVKILHQRALKQPELESFRREIFTLATLNHYALLKFYGYTDDSPFLIVTEYMQNGSLFDTLRKNPTALTPTIRSLIAYDVAQGLKYLHERNIIHRDLKSLNILLDDKFRAKICDFGMVRTRKGGPMTGLIGTAHWMAPEVLMSSPSYDERVDVYSYGIFLWELLTGKMVYEGLKPAEITIGVIEGTLRPEIPKDTPQYLSQLIQKCWSQQPEDRPPMSRVVSLLSNPKYHFSGTDEEEFNTHLKSLKHKQSSHKKRRHSSKLPIPSQQEVESIFEQIQGNYDESKLPIAKKFADYIQFKSYARLLANNGGCRFIIQVLSSKSSAVDYILKGLKYCKAPEIFDVEVLKILLSYSSNNNPKLRRRALSSLITGSNARFEFICSTPSFILQILIFLRNSLPTKLIISLMELVEKLIDNIQKIPEGILPILFWSRNNLDAKIQNDIDKAIISGMRFNSAKMEISNDEFNKLIININQSLDILTKYCDGNQPLPNDKLFIALLFSHRNNHDVIDFLSKIAGLPRFSQYIVQNLPIGEDTATVSKVYLPLLPHQEFYNYFANIQEFYSVASYLIANHQMKQICSVLKNIEINPSHIKKTSLCQTIAKELKQPTPDTDIILLMAAIFSISNVTVVDEFVQILPTLLGYLFNNDKSFRMPAFLCIASISRYASSFIDFSQLMPVAAFFVNSDSLLMREVSSKMIQEHINEQGIDLNKVINVFIDSFHDVDNYTSIASKSIQAASRGRNDIDKSNLWKLSQIS